MTRARDIANWIPEGGDVGQILIKASTDDYALFWGNGPPPWLPADLGDPTEILKVNDAGDAAEWRPDVDGVAF